ncbi:MAG: TRAP transporter large permease subunit, partial [Comamonadaceae bacterium]|nr:TRAP transporter large permease subunit [Comamonadaceae bacterium]
MANVMVDGPITIPLMKRTGFRPPFAAAVEAVASTGGQLMPPIMGAAAFVMAEFLAVPYAQVALWAAIPALLYYVAVFFAVHFEAKRYGLAGVPRSELPRLGTRDARARPPVHPDPDRARRADRCGYSAPLAALVGALACLPVRAAARHHAQRASPGASVLDALEDGARNTLAVAMACACAGIVIGCVTITGLGITFTQVGDRAGAGLAAAGAGADRAGRHRPRHGHADHARLHRDGGAAGAGADQAGRGDAGGAHVRASTSPILSAITPPVALAVFAAASLAKANMWATGWAAMRAGAPAYIVPFMFVYEPALLTIGDWVTTLHADRQRHRRRGAAGGRPVRLPAAPAGAVAARAADRRRAAADQA